MRVVGKGRRERLIPVPRLHRRLERYVRGTAPLRPPAGPIFLALRRGVDGHLSPSDSYDAMLRVLEQDDGG